VQQRRPTPERTRHSAVQLDRAPRTSEGLNPIFAAIICRTPVARQIVRRYGNARYHDLHNVNQLASTAHLDALCRP
jgi:hypothetical protein